MNAARRIHLVEDIAHAVQARHAVLGICAAKRILNRHTDRRIGNAKRALRGSSRWNCCNNRRQKNMSHRFPSGYGLPG